MRFMDHDQEKARSKIEGDGENREDEGSPQRVGLRDRIAHFTWYVQLLACFHHN